MGLAAVPQLPPHLVATGAAALTAVYPDAGNPFVLPHLAAEGLPAWTVTGSAVPPPTRISPAVVHRNWP